MNESAKKMKKVIVHSILVMLAVMAIITTGLTTRAFAGASGGEEAVVHVERSASDAEVAKFGLIGAAIAFGLGAIGAGVAISHVGAAAIGAIAEKPQMFGQALIFVALAEGLVVFGFITALMILGKV